MTRTVKVPLPTTSDDGSAPTVTPFTLNVSSLSGAETGNSLKCRVGSSGPNCHVVHQTFRLSQDIDATCRDLGITRAQALQALIYHQYFGVPRDPEQDDWQELGLRHLFSHDDNASAE